MSLHYLYTLIDEDGTVILTQAPASAIRKILKTSSGLASYAKNGYKINGRYTIRVDGTIEGQDKEVEEKGENESFLKQWAREWDEAREVLRKGIKRRG